MGKFLIILCIFLTAGCNYVRPSELIQHSYLKNYTVGEVHTAFIGQPIAKVRDYYEDKYVSYSMKPTKDFLLEGKYNNENGNEVYEYNVKVTGKKETNYPCRASVMIGNNLYYIITVNNEASDNKETIGVLVDNEGLISPDYIIDEDNTKKMSLISAKHNGDGVKFVRGNMNHVIDEKQLDLFACYTNFELLYGGINKVSLNLTYREFTIEDMARPSFFQHLIYEPTAKLIRFNDVLLNVIEATNEKIVYQVKSDNLTERAYSKDYPPAEYVKCKNHYERLNVIRIQ